VPPRIDLSTLKKERILSHKRKEIYDKHKSFLISRIRKNFGLTEEEALSYYKLCECDNVVKELSWVDFINEYYNQDQNYKKMSLSKEYKKVYAWTKVRNIITCNI
jgi:hypothetical protein